MTAGAADAPPSRQDARAPLPDPAEVEAVVAEARARARALVVEDLVADLVPRYRRAADALLAPPAAGEGTGRDTDGPTACYVYAVARREELAGPEVGELVGVEDRRIELVEAGELVGVTATVPLAGFRDLEREPDLAEDGWLARAARAHERVVAAAFARATVLPLRFGSLYPSGPDVVTVLRGQQQALAGELARLDGAAEWCVRAFVEAVPDATEPAPEHSGTGSATGTEWMLRRRDLARGRAALTTARAEVAEDVREMLSRDARDAIVHPGQRRVTASAPVHDGAYLFGRDEEHRLRAATDALARRHARYGLRFQASGPWPPYHFVRLPERVGRG